MVYLRDPSSRPKRTMPLLTGESGELGDATPTLGDDAHPCSPIWSQPSLTHRHPIWLWSLRATLKHGVGKRILESCVLSFYVEILEVYI